MPHKIFNRGGTHSKVSYNNDDQHSLSTCFCLKWKNEIFNLSTYCDERTPWTLPVLTIFTVKIRAMTVLTMAKMTCSDLIRHGQHSFLWQCDSHFRPKSRHQGTTTTGISSHFCLTLIPGQHPHTGVYDSGNVESFLVRLLTPGEHLDSMEL